ncbi:hypothetical protein [Photorhabdus heterorhabditis]|uniref:hypothetical protein n=1 Tax=Photorhabdus heterorhabditis TaxID=880156 RepID=UPI001561BCBD|nr:hypothetical protein [Photorhabdus heterorhabditis]NRN30341.1 hypothetical protein [Photorhabdus heterorhabditis subsp. aluminescens]
MSYLTNISVISVLYILLNVYFSDLKSDKLKLYSINIYFYFFIRIKFYLYRGYQHDKKEFYAYFGGQYDYIFIFGLWKKAGKDEKPE